MLIRTARPSDLPGILAITNEVIRSSTAIYSLEPVTLDERRAWFEQRQSAGYPVIVAEDASSVRDGEVVGFASFTDWRGTWPGYRYTVEHSVHVRADWRGKGLGKRLLSDLLPLASERGKHVMLGGIDAENQASLRLHAALGFSPVAHFREVGHKFGRWLDLVFVQRFVDAPDPLRP